MYSEMKGKWKDFVACSLGIQPVWLADSKPRHFREQKRM
jgi:hypothetical protein